jgi:MFS family permease
VSFSFGRFYPATSAISEWFDQKRGLALGIAVAGSSAGGIFWPIVIGSLLNTVGEATTQRVMAAICLPPLLAASVLVVERPGTARHDTHGHRTQNLTSTSIWVQVIEWRFLVLSGALFFLYCGMLVPFFYIPLYAEVHGVGTSMGNTLLAICYGGSVLGRISSGWFADRLGR